MVIGVINVTPDSFSDGGEWFDPKAAIAHGRDLLDQGADIVEVGGESTRPGAGRTPVAHRGDAYCRCCSTTSTYCSRLAIGGAAGAGTANVGGAMSR